MIFRLFGILGLLRLVGIRLTTVVVIGLVFIFLAPHFDLAGSHQIPKNPVVKARTAQAEKPKTETIWTATRSLTARENAEGHFRKHNRDFGFQTADDYIAAATDFLHNPPPGTQSKTQSDGDTVRFHAPTRRFAVMRDDGTPRTYYKLKPDIHGYPTNQAYFDAQ